MATSHGPGLGHRDQSQAKILQGTPKVNFDKPIDYTSLAGRTAIITGGSSGIGQGTAKALAAHGAQVAILDLSHPPAGQTGGEGDDKNRFFQCDVSAWDSLRAAFESVLAWSGGRLDVVVLSAGLRSHNFRDLVLQNNAADGGPVQPPSAVFDVNLVGTYYTAYLALWYFKNLAETLGTTTTLTREETEQLDLSEGGVHMHVGDGRPPQLLFLGSLSGYIEHPLSTDYCASKHGVRGLWKSVRAHGALFGGAQMNLLAPTFINNRQGSAKPRAAGLSASPSQQQQQQQPGPPGDLRMGEVEDVVEGALRCLCDVEIDGR